MTITTDTLALEYKRDAYLEALHVLQQADSLFFDHPAYKEVVAYCVTKANETLEEIQDGVS